MRFRGKALAELSAPEKLDEAVRLATVPSWLVGLALVVAVGTAGIWSFAGTLPRTVDSVGVLTHVAGVSSLEATTEGRVTQVWVGPDDRVRQGEPLYSAVDATGQVRNEVSPWDAIVVSMALTDGMLLQPGDRIAALERLDTPGDELQARLYVPAARAPMLRVGSPVEIDVASVPAAAFGTLSGTVSSVGQFPESEASLRAFHGGDRDVRGFLANGAPIAVTVRLDRNPRHSSGLAWSKGGPPYTVVSQSDVRASVTVATERPIDWLVQRS